MSIIQGGHTVDSVSDSVWSHELVTNGGCVLRAGLLSHSAFPMRCVTLPADFRNNNHYCIKRPNVQFVVYLNNKYLLLQH